MPEYSAIETRMIPSDPVLFRSIREWLAGAARKEGFDERAALELTVAVNEACANIHRHAYSGREDGEIEFRMEIRGSRFSVRIRDYGRTFRPESYKAPDLQQPTEGGYGVYLIRELMDEVEYIHKDMGTELRMTKCRQSDRGCEEGGSYAGQT